MTFRLYNSETKPLTKEFVAAFRTYPASPTEREPSSTRITHLQNKVINGLAIPFGWATAKLGDQTYRMNGYHSSTMLAGLNGAFPEGLTVHLDSYEVDSEKDLAELFRQFDDRKSGRSPADVCGAYQGVEDDLRGLPKPSVKVAIEGVAWYERTLEGVSFRHTGDDLYELLSRPAYHPFLQWVGDNVLNAKTPELKKAQVTAAMYSTFIAAEKKAQAFWGHVASGGDKVAEDTAFILDSWLLTIKEGGKLRGGKKILPAQIYQGCMYAWRAHVDGRTIKDIKFDLKKGFIDPGVVEADEGDDQGSVAPTPVDDRV
jgi:hypothetical protein